MNENNNKEDKVGKMLKGFGGYFGRLYTKGKETLDSAKAKKIRKQLITWGIVITAVSAILMIVGVILMFAPFVSVSNSMNSMDMSTPDFNFALSIAGFIIVSVFGFGIGLGVILLQAGLAIVVTEAVVDFADVRLTCPKCGDVVQEDEQFCNKCGADLRHSLICKKCNTQNEIGDEFCRKCGEKLN